MRLVPLDLFWEGAEDAVLQTVLLALMVCFHQAQAGNIYIQVHLLFDTFVPCAESLDLRIGKSGFVDVLAGAHRGFTGHDL